VRGVAAPEAEVIAKGGLERGGEFATGGELLLVLAGGVGGAPPPTVGRGAGASGSETLLESGECAGDGEVA
jgi:hypothetical protein